MAKQNYQNREVIGADSDDEDDDAKRTIFCANLDQRVTEELLYEVFLQAGPIESVRIPKDNSGRQKTFGFVTYVHRCSVPYAMSLLFGLSLFRKNLTIKEKYQPPPTNNFPATDCEPIQRRPTGGRDNYDHRGNNSNGGYNPFKAAEKTPPQRVEWVSNRRSDDLQKHPSHNKRPHQISPYSRSDTSRDYGGGGCGGSGSSGGNHKNSNSRRQDQRSRRR